MSVGKCPDTTKEATVVEITRVKMEQPTPVPATRQLTREEFLLQMGLTSDDLNSSANKAAANRGDIALRVEPSPSTLLVASGEAPVVLHDDQWLRSTVFTDISGLQAESGGDPNNAARKAIMESYKTRRSYGNSTPGSGGASSSTTPGQSSPPMTGDSPSSQIIAAIDRKANELVSEEDHALAQEYKASLLDEFRKRKKNGEAKVPPVSPPRQR